VRRRGFILSAVALGLASYLWWTREPAGARAFTPAPMPGVRPRNVLLVTIDTVRADHLSLYGYPRATSPHLDAFARAGITYDNAYTPATFTSPSVVSLLTGVYPAVHGVRFLFQPLADGTWTLPAHLRAHGWRAGAVVSNFVLKASASGLAPHFDDYDDRLVEAEVRKGKKIVQRPAADTTDAAVGWLRQHAAGPFFLWVHYIDPHGPYAAPPPFDRRFRDGPHRLVKEPKIPDYQRILHIADLGYYVDQYDGELAYADEHLGRLLAEANALGLLASTMVIVTSDHGETLTERHGGKPVYFDHGFHVWEELARVPLVVYRPGGPTGRSGALVSLTDIVPTILDALGVPPPAGALDGLPLDRPARPAVLIEAAQKPLRAVRGGPWKLFATVDTTPGKSIRNATLVDLRAGTQERLGTPVDGNGAGPPLLAELARQLARDTQDLETLKWEAEIARMKARAPHDPRVRADLERLRALGYVQ
jgi:arylsulfatase A-like enzyme